MRIEWDSKKAEANRRKHGVTFIEAAAVLSDPLSVTISDLRANEELRHVTVGLSDAGRTLIVVYADDGL